MSRPSHIARRQRRQLRRAMVLVLGDVGRSPRAQLHALSLAEISEQVLLVGYAGSEPFEEVLSHPRIQLELLVAPRPLGARPDWLELAGASAARAADSASLLLTLSRMPQVDLLLTQTPPALPTLALAGLLRATRARAWICDWHNQSHAMLALKLGARHPLVALWRALEHRLGRLPSAHVAVSDALSRGLRRELGIERVVTLHDRPVPAYGGAHDRGRLLSRLFDTDAPQAPRALVVSSTSWSLDEDFELLLRALCALPQRGLPPIDLVITGDGPQRARYVPLLQGLAHERLRIVTAWLPSADYRRLLASADLGLCLHRSATGLDLPMKVADMLGAGLPVCALDYGPVLREQLVHGHGALLFTDERGLCDQLEHLLEGFPSPRAALFEQRRAIALRHGDSWPRHWRARMLPLLASLLGEDAVRADTASDPSRHGVL